MPEGRQAQVHRGQGQGEEQAKAEKACQDAYTKTLKDIDAKMAALDSSAPDYDAQRTALEDQQTAAGTTQQACLKKAQK